MNNARQYWSNILANMYFRLANETMVMHGVHNKLSTEPMLINGLDGSLSSPRSLAHPFLCVWHQLSIPWVAIWVPGAGAPSIDDELFL